MNRRQFLQSTAVMAAATSAPAMAMHHAKDCGMAKNTYGVQAWMVRDSLAKSVPDTLAALESVGITEMELFGFGAQGFESDTPLFNMSIDDLVAARDASKVRFPVGHLNGPVADLARAASIAKRLGCHTLIESMAPELLSFENGVPRLSIPQTLAEVDAIADRLNGLGKQYAEHGLQFAYHNHHMEFAEVEGQVMYHYLMSKTDPELVKVELDLGWAAAAGQDPVALIVQYGDRLVSTHMKDYDPSIPMPENPSAQILIPEMVRLKPPGEGKSDFVGIVRELNRLGVKHRFIEVDYTEAPIKDLATGYCNLSHIDRA